MITIIDYLKEGDYEREDTEMQEDLRAEKMYIQRRFPKRHNYKSYLERYKEAKKWVKEQIERYPRLCENDNIWGEAEVRFDI